jgi:hypothetical protein
MANVKFKLNKQGVKELMKSPEMMQIVTEYANNALGRLGEGYEVNTRTGRNRVNAEIRAESYMARKDNSENNSILKALRG